MPIALRTPNGVSSGTGLAQGSAPCAVPSGAQNGDYLVFFLTWDSAATVTVPSGLGSLGAVDQSSGYHQGAYGRLRQAADPNSYTFNFSLTADYCVACAAFTGVNQSTPTDGNSQNSGTASHNITVLSMTASGTGDMMVCGYGQNANLSSGSPISPANGQSALAQLTPNGLVALTVADELLAASGATGNRVGNSPSSTLPWTALGVLLFSADGVGPSTGLPVFWQKIKKWRRRYLPKTFWGGGKRGGDGGIVPDSGLLAMLATALVIEKLVASGTATERAIASGSIYQG
jgi:hypothetical protein